jgi:hypothetical protein
MIVQCRYSIKSCNGIVIYAVIVYVLLIIVITLIVKLVEKIFAKSDKRN